MYPHGIKGPFDIHLGLAFLIYDGQATYQMVVLLLVLDEVDLPNAGGQCHFFIYEFTICLDV